MILWANIKGVIGALSGAKTDEQIFCMFKINVLNKKKDIQGNCNKVKVSRGKKEKNPVELISDINSNDDNAGE